MIWRIREFRRILFQPDWVPPEVFDLVAEDKARCMSEHGTTQGQQNSRSENDQRILKKNFEKSRSIKIIFQSSLNAAQIDDVDKGNLVNEPSITCYMYCLLEAFSLVSFFFKETFKNIHSVEDTMGFSFRWTMKRTWTRI